MASSISTRELPYCSQAKKFFWAIVNILEAFLNDLISSLKKKKKIYDNYNKIVEKDLHIPQPEQERTQEGTKAEEEDTDAPTTQLERDTMVISETQMPQMSESLIQTPNTLGIAVRPPSRKKPTD